MEVDDGNGAPIRNPEADSYAKVAHVGWWTHEQELASGLFCPSGIPGISAFGSDSSQQQQTSQMMSLVQQRSRTGQEVDDGNGAHQESQGGLICAKSCPCLDGGTHEQGLACREIEAWVEYLEVFLPWIALFDDRIPSEVQACFVKDKPILNKDLAKGESIRSTRVFLYLR